MEWVKENPKFIVTAFVGVVLWTFQKFVLDLPAEIEAQVKIVLSGICLVLMGRFSRISKSEAKILERIEDNKNQL